jgi:hypothetical protein
LHKINDEGKVRRSTRAIVLGTAKVMSYEDLEEAKAKRAKQGEKKVKRASREAARSRIPAYSYMLRVWWKRQAQ